MIDPQLPDPRDTHSLVPAPYPTAQTDLRSGYRRRHQSVMRGSFRWWIIVALTLAACASPPLYTESTPPTVPSTLPRPPASEVPPITTAAIASSSAPWPDVVAPISM